MILPVHSLSLSLSDAVMIKVVTLYNLFVLSFFFHIKMYEFVNFMIKRFAYFCPRVDN